jgi:hypothetical protein
MEIKAFVSTLHPILPISHAFVHSISIVQHLLTNCGPFPIPRQLSPFTTPGKSCVPPQRAIEWPVVEQAVPLIYTRDTAPPAMRVWARLVALSIAIGSLAVLLIGMWLEPNGQQGMSTHTQLGLQRCQFEARTGIPCPSCGFTTSVSYFAHGNVAASVYIQPMGFVIAVFLAASVWAGSYIAFTGRPVHRLVAMMPGRLWLIVMLVILVGAWAWKIAIHLTGHDHWPV